MNSTLISDTMGKMPAAMLLKCLSEAYWKLNLAYCMSLTDSSFGPEGQNRELLDRRDGPLEKLWRGGAKYKKKIHAREN